MVSFADYPKGTLQRRICLRKPMRSWGCGLLVEYLPNRHKAPKLIPPSKPKYKQTNKQNHCKQNSSKDSHLRAPHSLGKKEGPRLAAKSETRAPSRRCSRPRLPGLSHCGQKLQRRRKQRAGCVLFLGAEALTAGV